MKRVKVRELSGATLDWAVARCEGWEPLNHTHLVQTWMQRRDARGTMDNVPVSHLRYSTDWERAGLIIERAGIDLRQAKQNMFSIYEYRHIDRYPDAEIIMMARKWGPDRLIKVSNPPHLLHGKWMARLSSGTGQTVIWSKTDFLSDTPLIAAMRCYVASKLGEEIEIPEGLNGK